MSSRVLSGTGPALPSAAAWTRIALALAALVVASQSVVALVPLAMCAALVAGRGRRTAYAYWPVLLLVAALALVNSQKWPDSDLGEYYGFIDYAARTPLSELLFGDETYVSISPDLILFRAFAWLVAMLSGGSGIAFTLISTTLIYGALAWLCHLVLRTRHAVAAGPAAGRGGRESGEGTAPIAICSALLLAVTFSVTAHLTRQYLAGALFFTGAFAFWADGRRRWLLLAAASVLVHTSTLLLALPLALALLHRRHPRLFWLGVGAVFAFGASGILETYIDAIAGLGNVLSEEGAQGSLLVLLDGLVVAAVAWLNRRTLGRTPQQRALLSSALAFAVAFGATMFVVRDIPLLFFRSYFYFEFIRTPLVALLLYALLARAGRARLLVAAVCLAAAGAVCWQRTLASEWDYGSGGRVALSIVGVLERWTAIDGS